MYIQVTACHFVSGLKRAGHRLHSETFFDTLKITCSVAAKDIFERAAHRQINLRVYSEGVVRIHHHALENAGSVPVVQQRDSRTKHFISYSFRKDNTVFANKINQICHSLRNILDWALFQNFINLIIPTLGGISFHLG